MNLKPHELFGEIEFMNKLERRIFSVIANSNNNEVWYIPYEKFDYIANKDIKAAIIEYSKKQQYLINKVYNNLNTVERTISIAAEKRKEDDMKSQADSKRHHHHFSFDDKKVQINKVKAYKTSCNFYTVPKIPINKIDTLNSPTSRNQNINYQTSENFFRTEFEKDNKYFQLYSHRVSNTRESRPKTRNEFIFTNKDWINQFYTERNNQVKKHNFNFMTTPTSQFDNLKNNVSLRKVLFNVKLLGRKYFSPQSKTINIKRMIKSYK